MVRGETSLKDEGLLRVIGTGALGLSVVNMVGACVAIYVIRAVLRNRGNR